MFETGAPGPGAPSDQYLTVGNAAALLGVSVRTLHHWDGIGLARPSRSTPAYGTQPGYRVYSTGDIARLQQVLVYREVGFSLAQIGGLLDAPDTDAAGHLLRQRGLLLARIDHLTEMVRRVDRMRKAISMTDDLTAQDLADILGSDWNPEYADEAQQRWGDTQAWAQSQERGQNMSRQDWENLKDQSDALDRDMAAAVRDGVEPGSEHADALAERHRASIAHFVDCTHARHVCLARMYLCDERFTARYEAVAPGLTQWLHDAICANALAHSTDPQTAQWE